MNRSKMDTIIAIIFTFLIFWGCMMNFKHIVCQTMPKLVGSNQENLRENITASENDFQNNFKGRDKYIEIYGVAQKLMGRNIVGNFEYIREDGAIYSSVSYLDSTDKMIQEIEKVKAVSDKYNTPFLYIQAPNRDMQTSNNGVLSFLDENKSENIIVSTLESKGVDVLDERQVALSDSNFDTSNMFFDTDLHLKTETELWAAKVIGEYLVNEKNVQLNNLEYLQCGKDKFQFEHYEFLGNYARSVGKYYVGLDTFLQFKPNFDTDYIVTNRVDGTTKAGRFEDVVMNGYEKTNTSNDTYWITNYLMYGCPYYTITNNMQSSGKILIITDSIGYRTISMLSLTANEITVLDPRFFGGTDYITKALAEGEYDIVVLYQGIFLSGFGFSVN